MRLIVAWGIIMGLFLQTSMPASAQGIGTGIGQGFLSGVGWGLCSAVGKGLKKMAVSIKNRKNKSSSDQTADTSDKTGKSKDTTPEDYYNRGLEDGYYHARSEGYDGDKNFLGGKGKHAVQADGGNDSTTKTSVHGRRLADNRRQSTSSKGLRGVAHTLPGVKTAASTRQSKDKKQGLASQAVSP